MRSDVDVFSIGTKKGSSAMEQISYVANRKISLHQRTQYANIDACKGGEVPSSQLPH